MIEQYGRSDGLFIAVLGLIAWYFPRWLEMVHRLRELRLSERERAQHEAWR